MTDDDQLDWRALYAEKRALLADRARELRRAPGFADVIRASYDAQLAAVDKALAADHDRAVAENYWLRRSTEHPLAAELTLTLLAARSGEDVFRMMRNLADRFVEAAQPVAEPEPEWSEGVAEIDANNPIDWTPRTGPSAIELQRQAEERKRPPATHSDPLQVQWEQAEKERKRKLGNRNPDAVAARYRAEAVDAEQPHEDRAVGTATHRQLIDRVLRRGGGQHE